MLLWPVEFGYSLPLLLLQYPLPLASVGCVILLLMPCTLNKSICVTPPESRQSNVYVQVALFRHQLSSGGGSPTSTSSSASSLSSSVGSTTGLHYSNTYTPSQPEDVLVHLSSWSALVMHSPGTTSPTYQCPLHPPQFGHLVWHAIWAWLKSRSGESRDH